MNPLSMGARRKKRSHKEKSVAKRYALNCSHNHTIVGLIDQICINQNSTLLLHNPLSFSITVLIFCSMYYVYNSICICLKLYHRNYLIYVNAN